MDLPSPNGTYGRDAGGRFAKGNSGGPGNPHARHVAALRAVLLESVTVDDLRAVVAQLVLQAKQGDLAAIRELLDRAIGRPLAAVAVAVEVAEESPASNLPFGDQLQRLREICAREGIDLDDFRPQAVTLRLLNEPAYLDYLRKEAAECMTGN